MRVELKLAKPRNITAFRGAAAAEIQPPVRLIFQEYKTLNYNFAFDGINNLW